MALISQNRRMLSVTTPLGADAFLATAFAGREELSRPFEFALDLVSENTAVAAADLVGKAVGWTVNYPADAPRPFHGYVRRLTAGPHVGRGLRAYRAEVVPWLWFLTRTADCRIFQNKTAPAIVEEVFGLYGFSDYELKLDGSYAAREYCVQYRESAFDFVSRLMEEEGIYYYYTFAEGSHKLVLADGVSAYHDCAAHATAEYRPESDDAEAVFRWDRRYEFGSGKWAHTDYNFETPSTALLTDAPTTVRLANLSKYEVFDYPGRYGVAGAGTNLVKVRMEQVEAGYDTAAGASRCSSFAAGGKFTLAGHPSDDAAYVVAAVEHSATEGQVAGVAGGTADYRNTFVCLPAAVPFRPARTTPRAVVRGPQPAVVVGPAGSEIHTDQYGRVKVQFFWDRVGQRNENSSCWMRVAELWAGKKWGIVFTPRVGQEVIVDFLEGDPDRPLVTGRVYNAEQMPPYPLPDNMTQSGLKTRSTTGGADADFNELRFEDKKGEEDVYFHAQKDFHRYVENDDDLKVMHDQTITVKNDRTEEVTEGNESITIKKGNRTEEVSEGDETVTIKTGKRTVTVKADETLTVQSGNRVVSVDTGNDTHTVKTGNREVSVDTGNDTLTVKTGNISIKASAGAVAVEAAQSITLKVGGNSVTIDTSSVTIEATAGVTLKVGSNSVKVEPGGVTAAGVACKVEGTASAAVTAPMTQVSGDGTLTLKGGAVMIN